MYELGYECQNTFNIIISSNNDSINLSLNNNSRYVVLDISEHRIGDTEYFKQVTKALNNDDVKRSFYQDMLERFKTLDKWNEDIMPETVSRDTKIIEALPIFYKYIKEQYILTETDINAKTDEFFMEYRLQTKDKTSTQKLGRYIKALDITPIKLSKNAGYKYQKSSKELYDIFKAKKWIDEEVDLINPENPNKKSTFDDEVDYKCKYEEALKRIEQLEKQLQQPKPKSITITSSLPNTTSPEELDEFLEMLGEN
jgi:hypothetical protein